MKQKTEKWHILKLCFKKKKETTDRVENEKHEMARSSFAKKIQKQAKTLPNEVKIKKPI